MVASAGHNKNGSEATRKGPRGNWRNYAVIGVGLAVICGAAAWIGQYARSGEATAFQPPSNAVGTTTDGDKLALPVKPTIPVTLTVYEDPRSPESRAFAQQYSKTFGQLLASGQAQINYRLVTASDHQYGGSGAKEAAAAAACAQDQGRFSQFMDQVWAHQPAPQQDDFKNRTLLKKMAKKAGKIEHDAFNLCLDRGTRQGWVTKSQQEYASSGLGPVPVVQLNGKTIANPTTKLTPSKLTALVTKEAQRVAAAGPTASPSPSPTS